MQTTSDWTRTNKWFILILLLHLLLRYRIKCTSIQLSLDNLDPMTLIVLTYAQTIHALTAMTSSTKEIELKITLLGDKNVGKTELLNSYLEHFFTKSDSGQTHEE